MSDPELLPTNPSFPELLLKTLGNNGVLSYKLKCLSIGLILYLLGVVTTNASNTLHEYFKDYAFLVNTMTVGITFCAVIYACQQINPTIHQLNQNIGQTRDERFRQFTEKINNDRLELFWYYFFALGFSALFSIFGYTGFIGPPWVKAVSQNSRILNLPYYTMWCAVNGYILGVILNRLKYYNSIIHRYSTEFLTPEKINTLIPREINGLKPLGRLAYIFIIVCTIPSVSILITNIKTYIEGNWLFGRPLYMAMMVIYMIILIFLFFFPIRASHYTLQKAKNRDIHQLNEMVKQIACHGIPINPEGCIIYNNLILTKERIMKMPTWPLNASLFIKLLATILFPLIGGTIIQIIFEYAIYQYT